MILGGGVAEINITNRYPKASRNISSRKNDKAVNRSRAMQFERAYFDGTREEGYGGYHYDGRWVPIAQDIIAYYGLAPGSRVLDIGCAKGFLVKDIMEVCPGLEAIGLDISNYATSNGHPDVAGRMVRGDVQHLPFENDAFDAVICINVVHNLQREACVAAIAEVARVAKSHKSYIQVDAYRSDQERDLFLDWVLTAKTHGTPDFWRDLFEEAGYQGDYYWTVLELDPN